MANPSLGAWEFLSEHRNAQERRNVMHEKQDFEPAMNVSAVGRSCPAWQLASKAMPSTLIALFEPSRAVENVTGLWP